LFFAWEHSNKKTVILQGFFAPFAILGITSFYIPPLTERFFSGKMSK